MRRLALVGAIAIATLADAQSLGRIVSLQLVQAPLGSVVAPHLTNDTVVYLNASSWTSFTIRAIPEGTVKSVRFGWNGNPNVRTETRAPFTLCGGNSYARCTRLVTGVDHSITASVLSSTSRTATVVSSYTVRFRLDRGVPPPTTVAPSTASPVVTLPPVQSDPNGPVPTTDAPTSSSPTYAPSGAPISLPISKAPIATDAPQSIAPEKPPTNIPITMAPASAPSPTDAPASLAPVQSPTDAPRSSTPISVAPVQSPTDAPRTSIPVSVAPTKRPTDVPRTGTPVSVAPKSPTDAPRTSIPVSAAPVRSPTDVPRTKAPALGSPTGAPRTNAPSMPTLIPSPTQTLWNGTFPNVTLTPASRRPIAPRGNVPSPAPAVTGAPNATESPVTAPPSRSGDLIKMAPVLINCGATTQYIDTQRRVWMEDKYFTGGNVFGTTGDDILGTNDDTLYSIYRYGNFKYEIPVPQGLFEIVLHMAETYFDTEYVRVFDVRVETTMLSNIDIVDLGGGLANMAIQRVTSAIVLDGNLTIEFLPQPNSNVPLISALEVNRIGEAPPTNPPMVEPPTVAIKEFKTILINCGGKRYTDSQGRQWSADRYSRGGNINANKDIAIVDSADPVLFQSERWGEFSYELPVPLGSYEVILSFGDIYFTAKGQRVFDIDLEGEETITVDIVEEAGGERRPLQKTTTVPVMDGYLSLRFINTGTNDPSISGIEVRRSGDHFSHAVVGGPYQAVDADGNGFGTVRVDASQSHTHGPTHTLTAFTWRVGTLIVGSGKKTTFNLPVGEYDLTLTIVDSSGSISSDTTTVVVRQMGFPEVFSLSPEAGDIAGGTVVTILGQDIGNATSVRFGRVVVPQQNITVIDAGAISVISPGPAIGVPVKVSVVTPIGESNVAPFTYVSSSPIDFAVTKLMNMNRVTALAFGPDGKLYVGTQDGTLSRITLNDSYDAVVSSVVTTIDGKRCILGIAFDPMETPEMGINISAYISTSLIYHGQYRSTSGNAINGKIQKVNGPNLEFVTNIVTGLPVSEIDHSVNGIYFGDSGELYIGVGSNTNAGVPGGIMGSGRMKENYFSGAVLVANLGHPQFDGTITYNASDDGDPVTGIGPAGVEVFAAGTRNPFGVFVHSNGNVYATDNGPNKEYGPVATGCQPDEQIDGVTETDKLLLLHKGGYYGHANHKRAQTDPRQCIWRSNTLPSGNGFTAPLMGLRSSVCGLVEFESDHFDGQMRGDLILSKYNSELFRVILTPDGRAVNAFTDPAVSLAGNGGLAVTQAPDGSLIDARHTDGDCHRYKPIEAESPKLDIKAIFPRRGGQAGGSKLGIFGVNFRGRPTVTVGDKPCTNAVLQSPTKIECILPPGKVGRTDVTVTIESNSDTFVGGYRYITGLPDEQNT